MQIENEIPHVGDYKLSATEVADILWLASFLVSPVLVATPEVLTTPNGEFETTEPDPDDAGEPGGIRPERGRYTPPVPAAPLYSDGVADGEDDSRDGWSGVGFKAPRPPAILEKAAVIRSLRPLQRRIPSTRHFMLHEAETSERIAAAAMGRRSWLPARYPVPERWLDLVILVDGAPSMALWQQTVDEFIALLANTGIFRNVQRWTLAVVERDGAVNDERKTELHLYPAQAAPGSTHRRHAATELLDQQQRRLFVVISDCSSIVWDSGAAQQLLQPLTVHNLVSLVQVLPEDLWKTTALRLAEETRLTTSRALSANMELVAGQGRRGMALPIPVVSLEPESLHLWASFLAGRERRSVVGYYLPMVTDMTIDVEQALLALGVTPQPPHQEPVTEVVDLYKRFRERVPQRARLLAAYFAAAPLTLPVMRMIQASLLPQTSHADFVRVFYSGIIQRQTAQTIDRAGYDIMYDFAGGEEMREFLLARLPRYSTEMVVDLVIAELSRYIQKHLDEVASFDAIMAVQGNEGPLRVNATARHFAEITTKTLRYLGGAYASMADNLERSILPELPRNDVVTFSDLLEELSTESFIGRDAQLTLFQQSLTAPRPAFPILAISGQGGVGKSTLLEQYRTVARNHDAVTALVNEEHMTVTAVLSTFAAQLSEAGYAFKTFAERYRRYLELKGQVEADPNTPSGLIDWTIQSAARIGLRTLKSVPVAGDALDVQLAPETESELADQTTALARYLASKFINKDERVLLTDTDAELTRSFVIDINKYAATRRLIFMFDTFEITAPALESWLLNLLEGQFGAFSSNSLFVIAGRYPLGQRWTRWRRAIRQIELGEFTDSEARDYLARFDISDESQVSQLIEISERLPVLLDLLVSTPGGSPEDVSGEAVERFLRGLTPSERETALVASLPRFFNQDVLSILVGPEVATEAYTWLTKAHFVHADVQGWSYHNSVRSLMLRHFRLRSEDKYKANHEQLSNYYQSKISTLGLPESKQYLDERWIKYKLEHLYHHISQNPPQFVDRSAKLFINGVMTLMNREAESATLSTDEEKRFVAFVRECFIILSQISEEAHDSTIKTWASKFRPLQNVFEKPSKQERDSFFWLSNLEGFTDLERSMAFLLYGKSCSVGEQADFNQALDYMNRAIYLAPNIASYYMTRGRLFYEKANHVVALSDLSKAIELRPRDGVNYHWRGRAYWEAKDYSAALVDFTQAIELQPKNGINYFWRSQTYQQLGQHEAVLADLTQAITQLRRTVELERQIQHPELEKDMTLLAQLEAKLAQE